MRNQGLQFVAPPLPDDSEVLLASRSAASQACIAYNSHDTATRSIRRTVGLCESMHLPARNAKRSTCALMA